MTSEQSPAATRAAPVVAAICALVTLPDGTANEVRLDAEGTIERGPLPLLPPYGRRWSCP